jgi:hypothetical protein
MKHCRWCTLMMVPVGLVCLRMAAPACAQTEAGSGSRFGIVGPQDIPVPFSVSWMGAVLLGLMWLLIAAIVLGPIVRFFAPKPLAEPKNLPQAH